MATENNSRQLIKLVVTEDEATLLYTALMDYKDSLLKTKRTEERQEILKRCRMLKHYIASSIDNNQQGNSNCPA